MSHATQQTQRGFSIFEVMLAIFIFSLATVGLAVALEKTIEASLISRKESSIRLKLESYLAQVRQNRLVVGAQPLEPDERGVAYESDIELLDFQNQRNQNLSNLYRLTIRARWTENTEPQERSATLYVYQP